MDRVRAQLNVGAVRSGLAVACAAAIGLSACEGAPHAAAADESTDALRDTSAAARLTSFRRSLPRVEALVHGASSVESTLRTVVAAAMASDTLALARLAVTRAEWAWLYYPESRFVRPPYASPPELQWSLTLAASEKGVGRLLRELGGRRVRIEAVWCPAHTDQGASRLWRGCVVRYAIDGALQERRLTGTLLERGGRVKVLSYANDF
jgi:hypothetical protein